MEPGLIEPHDTADPDRNTHMQREKERETGEESRTDELHTDRLTGGGRTGGISKQRRRDVKGD